MQRWCKLEYRGNTYLGLAEEDRVLLYQGQMLAEKQATGDSISIESEEITWLPPVEPRQFLGLWNNFYQRMELEGTQQPDFPLYFVKLAGSLSAHQQDISRPTGFSSSVKFEAEMGIVMQHRCFQPSLQSVDDYIFGYTCVNDVTAPEELKQNGEFHQWCRAKSLPGFGPIGPWITQGIKVDHLRVQAFLDGEKKQDYPVSDMIFSPQQIVTMIASEIELLPGDVIACGTSVGASDLKAGQLIEVNIDGIGTLSNRFVG